MLPAALSPLWSLMSADEIWILVSNAALLLALAALYDSVLQQSARFLPLKKILVGAVIGTIAITLMLNPWRVSPGVVFDTRSILLSVTALFFGVLPALIAALMAALYRIFMGGAGVVPGVAVIFSSVLIGLGWRSYRPQWRKAFGRIELYLFGCTVHIVMLVCMLLLPWPVAGNVLAIIALPVLLIYPVVTVLLGMLLERKLSQREAECLVGVRERRFRKMIEKSGDIILLVDPLGRINYASESVTRVLGYSVEEMLGRGPTEHVHPVDLPMAREVLSALQGRPGESRSIRFRVGHRDGHWLWLEMVVTNLLEDPAVGAFVVNARDLSERQQIETRFEQRVKERTGELEKAKSELESFSYAVSHDMRKFLKAIDGSSKILLEGYAEVLSDEGRRLLDMVRGNAQRMDERINALLAFSSAGRVELQTSPIDMTRLARSAYDEVVPESIRDHCECTIAPLPTSSGDSDLLRLVWSNLLFNAISCCEGRQMRRIEVGGYEKPGHRVYFVRDNGGGFNLKLADKQFGVFQPLHGAEEVAGTGMGLVIVKQIVERHGGEVWAEGEENKGATFYFSLPER